jgi:hypothetical protein
VVNLSEEMIADVARLEDEEGRHEEAQPPASRNWAGKPSVCCALWSHQKSRPNNKLW